jgi:hypothetical protein
MTSPNADELDYLGHLARESARFAAAVGAAPPGSAVPTCPDWNADDLLWHLAEVQWFWGTIVREGVTTDEQVSKLQAERPSERPDLREFYAATSRDLGELLASAAPDTRAWTWAQDQTVGFIRRRQAHEALIHRIDAELTAGMGSRDEDGIQIGDSDTGTEATATISGTAADLDCWLWHRPPVGQIDRSGDSAALAALDQVLGPGIN